MQSVKGGIAPGNDALAVRPTASGIAYPFADTSDRWRYPVTPYKSMISGVNGKIAPFAAIVALANQYGNRGISTVDLLSHTAVFAPTLSLQFGTNTSRRF